VQGGVGDLDLRLRRLLGADPLLNRKVERFDFSVIATAFDQALAADPALSAWSLTSKLLDAHLGGSDSEALGGDLA